MAEATIERAALGRVQIIGDFYDTRRDCFVHGNLFNQVLPPHCVNVENSPATHTDFKFTNTTKEKLALLNLEGEISLSILCGLVKVSGSATYLDHKRTNSRQMHGVFTQNVTTQVEKVNLGGRDIPGLVSLAGLSEETTHVVVGIKRGCNAFMDISCTIDDSSSEETIRGSMKGQFAKFLKMTGHGVKEHREEEHLTDVQLKLFADVPLSGNLAPLTIEEGVNTIRALAAEMKETANRKGVPLTYVLLDVKEVSRILNLTLQWAVVFNALSVRSLERAKNILCESEEQLNRLNELATQIQQNMHLLPKERVNLAVKRQEEAKISSLEFQRSLATLIPKVRTNAEYSDDLFELFGKFESSPTSESSMNKFFAENDDLVCFNRFLQTLRKIQVNLLETSEDYLKLKRTTNTAVHVLFFCLNDLSRADTLWDKTIACFFKICESQEENGICAVVNTDRLPELAKCQKISPGTKIVIMRNNAYQSKDAIEDLSKLENYNLATPIGECERHSVDSLGLITAKISCPNLICQEKTEALSWYCSKCHNLLEFDLLEHFYCSCGRLPIDEITFKCSGEYHGDLPVEYEPWQLREELAKLRPYTRVNIVVIGETGVGKTTWINALPTYLSFPTLEKAEQESLQYLIPFQFNRSVPGKDGIETTSIKYGSSKNEVYAPRKSVTQQPRSYFFKHDETIYSIVDTPGVGDCDGLEQNKRNMQNIVDYVCRMDFIHLICFLLPPDQSKLHERFEFCFNELIMQFHRSAVENIAFCFTKASGVNFQVGDTSEPLKILLQEIKRKRNIDIPANRNNMFIFDNAAFLHIAAVQKEMPMDADQISLAQRSFNVSRLATLGMMRHALSSVPHLTEETRQINIARSVIQRLAGPLAMISLKVHQTCTGMEERAAKITRCHHDAQALYKVLTKKVIFYRYRMEHAAVTFCRMCSDELVLHGDERLPYIESDPDVANHDPYTLIEGDAIFPGGHCLNCGPEFEKVVCPTIYYKDQCQREEEDVNVRLEITNKKERAQEITRLLEQEKQLTRELEEEKNIITNHSTRFARFLKDNSILPINDVTENYLRCLMDAEEKSRGHSKIYYVYQNMLAEYRQEKESLERWLHNSTEGNTITSEGVLVLVEELQNLKHYGGDIRDALQTVSLRSFDENARMQNVFVPNQRVSLRARIGGLFKTLAGFF